MTSLYLQRIFKAVRKNSKKREDWKLKNVNYKNTWQSLEELQVQNLA